MRLADDLVAVERRMERIAGGPVPFTAPFGEIVDSTFARSTSATLQRPEASRTNVERFVHESGAEYRVDPALIGAVIKNESNYQSSATSSAGARGLMQLMPETAAALGVSDAYDARQNVRAGTRYLRSLLDRFGDVELALAAYNAGPAAVARFGGVPPYAQTRSYVRNVMAEYRRRLQLGNFATNERSQQSASIVQ